MLAAAASPPRFRLSLALHQVLRMKIALLSTLAAGACVSSLESDIAVHDAPSEDEAYSSALAAASKERTVFKDFETRWHLSATYLSPAFRHAFAQRLERIYEQDRPQLDEASSKAGFFVSLHSPDSDRLDLNNPQHWTILLQTPEGPLKPVLIKKLNDKERWRAFFDSVTEWTHEYLVVFDTPSVDSSSPALLEKNPMSLTFANADAQVKLTW